MEIMYIRFLKDEVLKDLELNFAHDFIFELKCTTLNVTKTNNHNIFKDPIVNLSMILGKNGSGKSTIIKRLLDVLHNKVNDEYILIIRKGKNICIYSGLGYIEIDKGLFEGLYKVRVFYGDEYIFKIAEDEKSDVLNIAYVSDFCDDSTELGSHKFIQNNIYNYNPMAIVFDLNEYLNDKSLFKTLRPSYTNYRCISKVKQLDFLDYRKGDYIIKDIVVPDKVEIEFSMLPESILVSVRKLLLETELISEYNELFKNRGVNGFNTDITLLLIRALDEYTSLNGFIVKENAYELNKLEIDEYLKSKMISLKPTENIQDILTEIEAKSNAEKLGEYYSFKIDEFKVDVIQIVTELRFNGYNNHFVHEAVKEAVSNSCIFKILSDDKVSEFDYTDTLDDLIDTYAGLMLFRELNANGDIFRLDLKQARMLLIGVLKIYGYINVEYSLFKSFVYLKEDKEFYFSSGEDKQIRLYSHILQTVQRIFKLKLNQDGNNLLLIIDEPDNGLHPKMQTEFIDSLVSYMSNFKDTKTQIIMSTHSPIIVSDLTSNHVNFLYRKDNKVKCLDYTEKKKTFAQNIYSLYKDSFFVEDAMVGKYADKVIMQIAGELGNSDDYEKVLPKGIDRDFVIDEIGEPVIKEYINGLRRKEDLIQNLLKEQGISDDLIQQVVDELLSKEGNSDDKN